MSSWFGIAIAIAVPFLLGVQLLRALCVERRDEPLGFCGFAYVVGSLALAGFVFAWLLLSLPIEFVAGAAIAGTAFLVHRASQRKRPATRAGRERVDRPKGSPEVDSPWFWRCVLAIAIAIVARHVVAAHSRPITIGDEANIWSSKAKAIYAAGGFNGALADALSYEIQVAHGDYPLWNPLLQVWTFAIEGRITHVENRYPIEAFWIALACILLGECRRRGTRLGAIVVLAFLTSGGVTDLIGQAVGDGMVATSGAFTIVAWNRYVDDVHGNGFGVVLLGLGALVFSKNEGALLAIGIGAGIAIELLARRRSLDSLDLRRSAPCLVATLALLASQAGFNSFYHLTNDLMITDPNDGTSFVVRAMRNLSRSGTILEAFFNHAVASLERTGGVFVIAMIAGALRPRALWRRARVEIVATLVFVLGIFVVYLGTPHDVEWQIRFSIDRLWVQIGPVVVLALAAFTARFARVTSSDRGA